MTSTVSRPVIWPACCQSASLLLVGKAGEFSEGIEIALECLAALGRELRTCQRPAIPEGFLNGDIASLFKLAEVDRERAVGCTQLRL